jgi:hypothetical protein
MTFNPNDIVITPNDWFWPNGVYEGRGRAEFEDPTGTIEGPVVAKFNEYGESSAQMVPRGKGEVRNRIWCALEPGFAADISSG